MTSNSDEVLDVTEVRVSVLIVIWWVYAVFAGDIYVPSLDELSSMQNM